MGLPGSTVAVVPIKPFDRAKSRLAGAVGPAQRIEIAAGLAQKVLSALKTARIDTLVVTSDSRARIIAAENGAEIIREEGENGLNAALARGIEAAEARGAAAVLLLHADLPHLAPEDATAATIRPGADGVTLAPAFEDGGTNALCLPLPVPISLSYGEGSFQRHLQAAIAANCPVRVIRRGGLAIDVDRPSDLGV